MPTAEKARTIEQAREWYTKSVGVVFTDYRGLTVKEIQGLRADLRKKGGEIHVIKNTLFRLAAGEDTQNMPAELHNGTTAVAFVFENEAGCAKTLLDYARTSKKLVVKGGFFGGKAFTSKQVEALSELPPRDVLISQVIGAIAAPLSGLIGTIEALYADPIRVIGAVADKVAESSPVEAKPAEAPAAVAAPEAAPEAPAAEAAPEAAPEATEPAAEASAESAPAADAEPEAAEPAAEAPAETSDDTNSTEASE